MMARDGGSHVRFSVEKGPCRRGDGGHGRSRYRRLGLSALTLLVGLITLPPEVRGWVAPDALPELQRLSAGDRELKVIEGSALLRDASGTLTAADVLSPAQAKSWLGPDSEAKQRWWSAGINWTADPVETVWVALRFQVADGAAEQFALVTDNPWIHEVDLYQVNEGGVPVELVRTGLKLPVDSRRLYSYLTALPFEVAPGRDATLLMRLHGTSPQAFTWKAWDGSRVRQDNSEKGTLYLCMMVLLLALSLYHLAVFPTSRDLSYLYLGGFLLGMGLVLGWSSGAFVNLVCGGSAVWLRPWHLIVVLSLAIVGMNVFTHRLLSAHDIAPRATRINRWICIAMLAACPFYPWLSAGLGMVTALGLVFLSANGPGPIIFIAAWRKQGRVGRYSVAGLCFLALGGAFYLPSSIPSLTEAPSLLSQTGLAWGTVGLAMFMSIALGERIRQDRDDKLAAQAEALRIEERAAATLQNKVEERTRELLQSMQKIRRLFDSLVQGVFTFGPDLQVHGNWSVSAERIFDRQNLLEVPLRELLLDPMADWDPEKNVLEQWLQTVFETPVAQFDALAELAPREIILRPDSPEPTHLQIEFRPVIQDEALASVLCLATDVTDRRAAELEAQAREQENQRTIAMLRTMSSGGGAELVRFLGQSEKRWAEIREVIACPDAMLGPSDVNQIFQSAHTVKGDARLHDLEDVELCAAKLEEILEELRQTANRDGGLSPAELQEATDVALKDGDEVFSRVRATIVENSSLGEAVLDQTLVSQSLLERLLEQVRVPGADPSGVAETAQRLAARPFGEAVARLQRAVPTWASNRGKRAVLESEGVGVPVPADLGTSLTSVLTHLVRNAVVHGVECPDEREASGKEPLGVVTLRCDQLDHGVRVRVEDDGRGLDLQGLRDRASRQGIEGADEAQASELVFVSGLSTATCADEMAGRGMGMAAVRDALGAHGYGLEVSFQPGRGTRVEIAPLQAGGAPISGRSAA